MPTHGCQYKITIKMPEKVSDVGRVVELSPRFTDLHPKKWCFVITNGKSMIIWSFRKRIRTEPRL